MDATSIQIHQYFAFNKGAAGHNVTEIGNQNVQFKFTQVRLRNLTEALISPACELER